MAVFTFFTRATWEGDLGETIPQLLLLLVLIGLAAIIVATPLLLEKAPKITIALLIKETMSFQQQFQIICGNGSVDCAFLFVLKITVKNWKLFCGFFVFVHLLLLMVVVVVGQRGGGAPWTAATSLVLHLSPG